MIKRIILVVMIIALLSGCSSVNAVKPMDNNNTSTNIQQNNEALIPNHGQSLEAFIPEGWEIKASIKGDLNQDSLPDIAAVIQKKEDIDSSFPRIIIVLFQEQNKSYTLSVKADKAILKANEGGVWGDPFDSIVFDEGSILLNFYGGSNWRWYSQYRFRFQDDSWVLIGVTLGSYFTGTTTEENADVEDYNLLTGDYVFKKADEQGVLHISKGNRGKKALVNLNNFIANSEVKQY